VPRNSRRSNFRIRNSGGPTPLDSVSLQGTFRSTLATKFPMLPRLRSAFVQVTSELTTGPSLFKINGRRILIRGDRVGPDMFLRPMSKNSMPIFTMSSTWD